MKGLPKIHPSSIPSLTLLTLAFAPSPQKSIASSNIQDLLLGANCSTVQEVDTIMTIWTFVKYLSSLPPMNSSSPQSKPSSDQAVGLRILQPRTTVLPCNLTTSSVSCVRRWSQRCGRRCRSHSGRRMGSTEVSRLKGLSSKTSTARDLMTRQTIEKPLNHGNSSTMSLLSRRTKIEWVGGGISSGYLGL